MTYIEKHVAWNQLGNTRDPYLLTDKVVLPCDLRTTMCTTRQRSGEGNVFSRVYPSVVLSTRPCSPLLYRAMIRPCTPRHVQTCLGCLGWAPLYKDPSRYWILR